VDDSIQTLSLAYHSKLISFSRPEYSNVSSDLSVRFRAPA